MADIALPRHQATQSHSAAVASPIYQRRQQPNVGMVEMVPNPDFSFPMRAAGTSSNDSSPTKPRPMSMQYPATRRGSMPHARQRSVNALPAFSFNPAGNAPPPAEVSPQTSPLLVPTTPAKPVHGHRRGGSELIGGSARTGATLLSSSPTKDGALSPPTMTLQPGPPAGRRGHAHRRSAAISSHDLSSIMNPSAPSHTGSAPNSPGENINDFKFGHSVNKSMSLPYLRRSGSDDESVPRPPSRARVGFSDKVEYIRPLSTISSETDASTLRGHSTANSLSSIVGGTTISPPFTRSGTPTLSTVEDESRPGTAGAILDKVLSNPLIEDGSDRKRPMSAVSSPSRTRSAGTSPTSPDVPTKKRGFFRLESRNSDKSTHRRLPTSISDPALTTTFNSSPLASPMDTESAEDVKPKSKKLSHRPRKVKSWANSIIPRKGKNSKKSKRRSSTPEQPDAVVEDEDTDSSDELDFDFSPNFDEDTSVTIVSPTADATPGPKINTDYASWQPRQLKRVDSDVMSPIIDMDAALGPFNTPNGANSKNQRGFSAHRRAMHSSSGFTPNHRRTESAPELVPFEFRPSAATNASPMADVFEEEEPEEEKPASRKASSSTSIGEEPEKVDEPKIQIVEMDTQQDGPTINWNFSDGLGLRRAQPRHSPILEEPLSPHAVSQFTPSADCTQIEVVEDHEEPRTSSLTHSSDSTVTPQSTLEEFKSHQSTMAVPAPLAQQSLMTPNTVTSSFGSPDYQSSQISFETPRVGTAASSVTDYPVMPSPRFGEPGPEMRMSSDDVPSLTSSRSTMISNMQGTFPIPAPRGPGDRSASLCSAPSEVESRRRKRSSIASLSRLINGSYGSEKSKLSIEQRPQSAYLAPIAKDPKKKSRRLSKLKFWKSSKDSASSSHAL